MFHPWDLPDWTSEQWVSWNEHKRNAMSNVAADIWHFECKKERPDYLADGVLSKLALATDLYLDGIKS